MNNKTCISVFLMGMLLGLPQFVLASENEQKQSSAWRMETHGWSIQDHMTAAKAKEGEVQSMETRVQDLEKRIAHFENKPYFDPKGFHRNALKHISSTLKGDTNHLNERIAWHYRQADQAKLTE
ncbi:MAG: hypothetical protein H0X47_18710 [Nitrospirales bacterium]|nr:hypothetical protein [Nitrospirales bacterium]